MDGFVTITTHSPVHDLQLSSEETLLYSSESLENIEEMFSQYYIHSDVCSSF